jgi:hypothetical protein
MQFGLDKSNLWFGQDNQLLTLNFNFIKIFSISSGSGEFKNPAQQPALDVGGQPIPAH